MHAEYLNEMEEQRKEILQKKDSNAAETLEEEVLDYQFLRLKFLLNKAKFPYC